MQDFALNDHKRYPWLEPLLFRLLLANVFVLPFSIALNEIFFVLTLAGWIAKLLVRREHLEIPPIGWFFIAFFLVTIASAGFSEYRFDSLKGIWNTLRYTATFFMVIHIVQTTAQARKIFWVLAGSTGLWAASGMIYQYVIVGRPFFDLLQFFSLGNKNSIGQYLQQMLAVLMGMMLNRPFRPREKTLLAAIVLISVLALFLTGAKTMWVAFLLTVAAFAVLKRSITVWGAVGVLVVLFLGAAWISPEVRERGAHILQSVAAPSMQTRVIGWEQSFRMVLDNPLWGVGPKAYMAARDHYQVTPEFGQAHNMILHTACEMGAIGVLSLLAWVGCYLYFLAGYRHKVTDPFYIGLWYGGVGYVVTLLIGGLTEPTVGSEHSQLFMLTIGLMQVGIRQKANPTAAARK